MQSMVVGARRTLHLLAAAERAVNDRRVLHRGDRR